MDVLMKDTIAAISTPHGQGAIGIVRISGSKAQDVLKQIFISNRKTNEYSPHKLIHGTIRKEEEIIDDVLAVFMPKGESYTGDDVVEIHAHGNPLILSEILNLMIKLGVRMAEPGEFTFRAYMNNKLDLVQAEAVMDVIEAKSQKALRVATQYLQGEYSKEIRGIRDSLLEVFAHTEASIDFTTEDIEVFSPKIIQTKIIPIKEKISKILDTYKKGRLISEGIKIAIIGRPNVGKSSLLNGLLNRERAIVTDEAGTTRDTIEEDLVFKGVTLRFIDTAGIREARSKVEKMGVEKSFEKIKSSDIIILVLDMSKSLHVDDFKLLDEVASRNHIIVGNKIDISQEFGRKWNFMDIQNEYSTSPIVEISALQRTGFEKLLKSIYDKSLNEGFNSESVFLTKSRHKEALEKALQCLEEYEKGVNEERSLEFLSLDLREAVDYLGEIIGYVHAEDVYDKIFSSFCIGK